MSTDQVVVTMYNVGFGDCFLVTIPTTSGPRRILIDCGTHPSSTGPKRAERDAVPQLMADLAAAGAERIDVVVASHRHKDHVSGFAAPDMARLEVGEVWLPWTENPDDPVATALRTRMGFAAEGLEKIRQALSDSKRMSIAMAAPLLENCLANEAAMAVLHEGFRGSPKRRFLSASAEPLTSPLLPGVLVHVLGPSKAEAIIRDLEPPPEQSWGHLAAVELGDMDQPRPFDDDWAISWDSFHETDEFSDLRPGGQVRGVIRQLAADELLNAAASLEKSINGTSLMFVLEIGELLLFFPGDAQWGTWKMVLDDDRSRDLVARSRFYKIGHHGSHNASPQDFVNEVMAGSAWAAVPVAPVTIWPMIPQPTLLRTIIDRKVHLVQSDEPPPAGTVPNVTVRDDVSIDFAFDAVAAEADC